MLKTLPPVALLAPVDPVLFRQGMSRVAGAVHVVTTDGPEGRAGFTATAVTPVTDDPAALLVCVNTAASSARSLMGNGVFCVNTLAAGDEAVAEAFAGRSGLQGSQRFAVGSWEVAATGAPRLATSLVSFDCRLSDARVVATHHVIVGQILAIRMGEAGAALLYRDRAYHALG